MREKLFWLNTAVSLLLILALLCGSVAWGVRTLGPAVRAGAQRAARDVAWNVRMVRAVLDAARWAYVLDRIYDDLPDKPLRVGGRELPITGDAVQLWGIYTNSKDLELVVEAVLPYFWYEFRFAPIRPAAVGFVPWDRLAAFHVLGRASCIQAVTLYNYEFVNPYSPRYQSNDLLPTIVHELGHVQGICGVFWMSQSDTAAMESANEVATWEVLAAMSLRGNDYAVKPTVGALRDGAMSYLRAVAREDGWEWLYDLYADHVIFTSPVERARRDKSKRFWASYDPATLDYIIRAYGRGP